MKPDALFSAPPDAKREAEPGGHYELRANHELLGMQKVETASVDETKPWKPSLTVDVVKADGSMAKGIDANTPCFAFRDSQGRDIVVTAATAGHIDALHIKGQDLGSKFDEPDLQALFEDAAARLPEGLADRGGISTFSIEMDKGMGSEGLASLDELVKDGLVTADDVALVENYRSEVQSLNREGDQDKMRAFVDAFNTDNPNAKIVLSLIRDGQAIVPRAISPKRPTTKLFVMMGPDASGTKQSIYTMAPGRDMPRHPIRGQHTSREKVFDEATFQQSADAWFDNVMLAQE